jgi:hypothetical protein
MKLRRSLVKETECNFFVFAISFVFPQAQKLVLVATNLVKLRIYSLFSVFFNLHCLLNKLNSAVVSRKRSKRFLDFSGSSFAFSFSLRRSTWRIILHIVSNNSWENLSSKMLKKSYLIIM